MVKNFIPTTLSFKKNKDSNNEISNVRFGFTATKRIGNAVNRNRAKRRMRSLISLFLKYNISSFENGNSYVLIAKASLINASFVNLKNEMKNCLNRL